MNVLKEQADSYYIRQADGGVWGRIFVQAGVGASGNHWAYVAAISDHGNYAYLWSSMGGDHRKFLAGLDFDYAMNKLTHGEYMQFDAARTTTELHQWVLRARREDSVSKDNARELFDLLNEMREDMPISGPVFMERMYSQSNAFREHDLYEHARQSATPEATAFWEKIWRPFAAAILAEYRDEKDKLIALCSPMGRVVA